MPKILIVEDDSDLRERLRRWLEFEKYTVEEAADGEQADCVLSGIDYDLIILDWELPFIAGVDLCARYRKSGGAAKILMLTGKSTLDDKESGLDAGADDYLTKPFEFRELSARIRALLRRPTTTLGTTIEVANLVLETKTRRVTMDGSALELLPKEYSLLEFFMKHPNEAFNPEALLERVWHSEADATIGSVYTYIKTLRKKITDKDGKCAIRTAYGLGYRFEA